MTRQMDHASTNEASTYEHHFVSHDVYRQNVFRQLNEIRKSEHLCDVVVTTDNGSQRFAAHRIVLSAASRYFHKLYVGTALTRFSRETILSGICEGLLGNLLSYIYTSEICINGENVRAILHAASSLGMDLLKLECEQYLEKHLHFGNCIEMMALASNYSCGTLWQKSKRCVSEHFLKLCTTQQFHRIPADQLNLILADDDLNITKEEEVYEALIGWIRYDFERRKDSFEKLLCNVRLACLSRRFLVGTVDREPLVVNSQQSKHLVIDALNLKAIERRVPQNMLDNKMKRRWRTYLMEVILVVGGMIEDTISGKCSNCFNPQTGKWYSLAKVKDDRLNFGMVKLDYWTITVGGSSAKENLHVLSNAEKFDPKFNTWSRIANMNQARFKCEAAEVNGDVYVLGGVGGIDSLGGLSAMECYNHGTDTWTLKPGPRQLRHTYCVAVLNGRIYVIGGLSRSNSVLRTVERYNPESEQWDTVAALNTPRSGACAVALAGKIYIMGGASDKKLVLNTCEVYHASQDKWFFFKDMAVRRDRADAAAFGGKIYVIGGSYGNVVVDSVECYDPANMKWKIVTYLPHPRHGFRCCTSVVNRDLLQEIQAGKPIDRSEQLI